MVVRCGALAQIQTDMSLAHTTVFYFRVPDGGDTEMRKMNFVKVLLGFLGERALIFCNVRTAMRRRCRLWALAVVGVDVHVT